MSIMLNGIGVSRGIGIGQAYVLYREQTEITEYHIDDDQVDSEIERYHRAKNNALQQLCEIKNRIARETPDDILSFIDTHLLMIDDPVLNSGVIHHIQHGCNAEWALQIQHDRLVSVFEEMQDEYLKTRKDDISHVVRSIQRCLVVEHEEQQPDGSLKGRLIVADDLTPADTLLLKHQKVGGFVTEYGGPLSHTAILARSLGIPAVVGIHKARQIIQSNETIIIDGERGMLIAAPDAKSLKHFRHLRRKQQARIADLGTLKNRPAVTRDGVHILLHGNIDRPADIRQLRAVDETGVGLYRTEMMFLSCETPPGEDEQFQVLRRAVKAMKGQPLTIRTLDLGADKEMKDTPQHGPLVHNPAMGLRAIRRCLKHPEQFTLQLKAILRASAYGPVKIMVPMMTCLSELDQTLTLLEQAKSELRNRRLRFDDDIDIGAMIEVPAAALSADNFAQRLDFLSIGTNDLIQYTLALDRIDDEVSYLYNPLHPSVLRLIDFTIKAGKQAGIPVSLCGEMASDPLYTRLLLGMGLEYFSVPPNAILEIKSIITNSLISDLAEQTADIFRLHKPNEIIQAVEHLNKRPATSRTTALRLHA